MQNHYRLFGGVLRTDLGIPELEIVDAQTPSWTLTSAIGSVPENAGELLGSDAVTGEIRVRLFRREGGYRLIFDDTGCFDIDATGQRITWTHAAGTSMADGRADLTGRVIAAALHAAGTVCLHGSAVVPDHEAIGFVAPKFHGKSTLALALVRDGAKLLTDDTLPVVPGTPPLARPGLHATRLWPDSARLVGVGDVQASEDSDKQLFASLPDTHITHDTFPLSAVYLLSPTREARDGQAAWRTRLSSTEAALVMIAHAKLAPLLGRSEAATLFRHAAVLGTHVPVFRLNVVRDLDRLDEVVGTIRSWHTSTMVPPSATG